MNFECTVCGYIYDVQKGEPEFNIAPGTEFELTGEKWECPICASPRKFFKPVDKAFKDGKTDALVQNAEIQSPEH